MNSKWWVVLLVPALGAILATNARISERMTRVEVEHIVEYKTTDKLDEIIRRLTNIEQHVGNPPQTTLNHRKSR